jgi:hypothetical protein
MSYQARKSAKLKVQKNGGARVVCAEHTMHCIDSRGKARGRSLDYSMTSSNRQAHPVQPSYRKRLGPGSSSTVQVATLHAGLAMRMQTGGHGVGAKISAKHKQGDAGR